MIYMSTSCDTILYSLCLADIPFESDVTVTERGAVLIIKGLKYMEDDVSHIKIVSFFCHSKIVAINFDDEECNIFFCMAHFKRLLSNIRSWLPVLKR